MPSININLSRLDEGNGIEKTFQENNGKWHKSCYTLFNTTKLKRAEKRRSDEPEPGCSTEVHPFKF